MGTHHLGDFDPDQSALDLAKDPLAYCRDLNTFSEEPRVIVWHWPKDIKREVMIPPGHFLLVRAGTSFCAQVVDRHTNGEVVLARENSLPCADGSHFALFSPGPCPDRLLRLTLRLSVYLPAHSKHTDANLLFLPKAEHACVIRRFTRSELLHGPLLLLGTNGCGGMLRANVDWSKLNSKYDALLAANLNPDFPEDRWIMFSRCRAWLVYQGYSKAIDNDCLNAFSYDDHFRGRWKYRLPCGQGQHVLLTIVLEMATGANAVRISFYRHKSDGSESLLSDANAVRIILRPDVEDRSFHHTTKGYLGPEHDWPGSVIADSKAFTFSPTSGRVLRVRISDGRFVSEPEWQYMVHRSLEAERGMDPDSDLFSPGYFLTSLKGGQPVSLWAQVGRSEETVRIDWNDLPKNPEDSAPESERNSRLEDALLTAMDAFVVSRAKLQTVIAGYPWFLDWGRDTLIFVRGLIAAGKTSTAGAILKQFAGFEDQGTLPNMIRGDYVANRDTSDAPFWFFVACSDLVTAQGNKIFLDTDCGGRTVRQALKSIAHSVIAGTPNGIRMDPDSGLIFSPSHFTWMDTNHPAGTPREGYPIEIQALWHFAASFMARIDRLQNRDFWRDKASSVQQSIMDLFFLEREGFLSDCLHAKPGEPARRAQPDDALRPNQLFAVTLGAVTDAHACRKIVHACETLIVPGAIRSLADREVRYPIPIVHHEKTINHPNDPYQGRYTGDEDSQRKPAYHNGTAWTWVFPSFCEAWVRAYGDKAKGTALAWLGSSLLNINSGCVGHVPEILDGDYPHTQRGCDAQAWGASELLRVLLALRARS